MMRLELRRHADTPCGAVDSISADFERLGPRKLHVRFAIEGRARQVAWPRWAAAGRADELWRHTCFEMFVRAGDAPDYREFNFATSRQWAAYGFTGYRSGMSDLRIPDLRLEPNREILPSALGAQVEIDPAIPADVVWHVGLSAVIEEKNGRISYWALRHPPGKADFHHEDCFALELPAAR